MSTLKVDTIQDTNAVEMYLCKAWVNFNGTGTVAIRGSGNVTSITDQGTGTYDINFTNAFSDANYSVVGTASNLSGYSDQASIVSIKNTSGTPANYTSSSCRIVTASYGGGIFDTTYMNLHFFGD